MNEEIRLRLRVQNETATAFERAGEALRISRRRSRAPLAALLLLMAVPTVWAAEAGDIGLEIPFGLKAGIATVVVFFGYLVGKKILEALAALVVKLTGEWFTRLNEAVATVPKIAAAQDLLRAEIAQVRTETTGKDDTLNAKLDGISDRVESINQRLNRHNLGNLHQSVALVTTLARDSSQRVGRIERHLVDSGVVLPPLPERERHGAAHES